jgi:HD superfamily phosphodiesterase
MDTDIVQTVAHYSEEIMGAEGFRYVSAVVANCKMLAIELEAHEEDQAESVDQEALIIAAYFHDISTVAHGFQDHHVKSAEMAADFLRKQKAPEEQIHKVQQALLGHVLLDPNQRATVSQEGQVLFDADQLGRLSGLAVVTSLIEFGSRYPNRAVTGDVLASVLRHIEERFIELYQSLYTEPARELARDKFNSTIAFLDGVIEHLSDATPV